MPHRSMSLAGVPDHLGSQTSLRKRKTSINDPIRTPSITTNGMPASDLLLDAITLSQIVHLGNHVESPVENVRRVVNAHPGDDPMVYSELMELKEDDKEWKEVSRWLKYEQMVEGDFTRFSKPHITLLQIQGLLQLKNCMRRGLIMLDVEELGFKAITDVIVRNWIEQGSVEVGLEYVVKKALQRPKAHLGGRAPVLPQSVNYAETDSDEEEPKEKSQEENITKILKDNSRMLLKLDPMTESCSILTGSLPSLSRPLVAFVRLKYPQMLHPEVPDLPLPTRFMFILLSGTENYDKERIGIGRTVGSLMADEIFRKVAFHCHEPNSIGDAVEEFFSQIIAIPAGKCDVKTRWQPKENIGQETRNVGMLYATYNEVFDSDDESGSVSSHGAKITRTGRIFGGLAKDIRAKSKWFVSDFTDFFRGLSQSLASTIFLFFANITSIITFGAVMERALHHQMASMEAIVCGGISGVIFALLSGQPLNVLSATGPTLVFEKILFDFCIGNHWEFLPFRCYVGIWIAVILVVLVATDMSALVGLITRFTEEAFATLISVVFVIQAFQKLLDISHDAPIVADPREVYHSPCYCHVQIYNNATGMMDLERQKDVTAEECELRGGEAIGLQCHFKPDVYMLSVLLTFGTFALSFAFKQFRTSRFFGSTFRSTVSDFGVVISIVIMTCFSHSIGLDVPSLNMPKEFKPTIDRSWIVDISAVEPAQMLYAFIPAAFYTILIVMDQQITAVIINRSDNKLRKGHGYHLDLLVIALLVLICSFLGLPFYVSATVLSVMHCASLRVFSDSSAPGQMPHFLGIREQRLTNLLAHVLIGLSVFLTPIIKLVPLPVLIGIFLYMGVVSLLGQQFVQRVSLFFMSIKHQPDYLWLRSVRMKRVHIFTIIQLLSILGLFAVKYTKLISMMFPLMLVFMVLIRMFILDKIFTKDELIALDDDLPSFKDVIQPRKKKSPSSSQKKSQGSEHHGLIAENGKEKNTSVTIERISEEM